MDAGIDGSDRQYIDLAVEVFRMLSDATRVRLLLAMGDGELSVADLADQVGKSPASTSQHLAKLRLTGLVRTRQEGTRVFYRVANEHVRQLVIDALFQAEHAAGGTPPHHRTNAEVQHLRARAGGDSA